MSKRLRLKDSGNQGHFERPQPGTQVKIAVDLSRSKWVYCVRRERAERLRLSKSSELKHVQALVRHYESCRVLWLAIIRSALRVKHLARLWTRGARGRAWASASAYPVATAARFAGRLRSAVQLSRRTTAAGSLGLAAPARAPDQRRSFPDLSEDD